MDINIIITQMTILFIIMALGYLVFKLKIVDEDFTKKFSSLVINLTMPAMLLSSVLEITERQSTFDVLLALCIAFVMFFIILPLAGLVLVKIFRIKRASSGLYIFMTAYSNVGFMGFPVIEALSGPVGLFYAAIYNLMFNLAIFTLGVWLMNKDKPQKAGFDFKLLLTPGVIASLLAIVLYFINIKPPVLICATIKSVGSVTSPSAMLIIGCTLAKMDIKSVFSDWKIYPWTIVKQLVIPILLWIPSSMIITNETLLTVTFILFAMPVANNAVLFANMYDGDSSLAARSVFITTLFSLVTVPLCVWIVQFI